MRKRVIFLILVLVGTIGLDIEAKRKRRRKRRLKDNPAIMKALGDLKWGMSAKEVINYYLKEIDEKYKEKLKTKDIMKLDRLREQKKKEIKRLRKNYVEFKGQQTGWEVSIIGNEFTHHNNEAMLAIRQEHSQDYLFFIKDRLWKRFVAFDAERYKGIDFATFVQKIEAMYGEGEKITTTDPDTNQQIISKVIWRDRTTQVEARDNTNFYGVFCLIYSDRNTLENIDSLRINKPPSKKRFDPLIESVTTSGKEEDTSADVIDRITGKRHEAPKLKYKPPSAK
jgi:hypothetical protein